MMRALAPFAAALLLAGCAYAQDAPESVPPPVSAAPEAARGLCNAEPARRHVGAKATAELGAMILAEASARTLRWGPPNSAWTMDYRADRVNVRYDDAMIITGITCG